jgi:hypothetical protein
MVGKSAVLTPLVKKHLGSHFGHSWRYSWLLSGFAPNNKEANKNQTSFGREAVLRFFVDLWWLFDVVKNKLGAYS